MSLAAILDKFRNCASFSARPVSAEKIEQVINLVCNLEQVEDATEIVRLLSRGQ